MNRTLLCIALIGCLFSGSAQDSILDGYIQDGFDNNLALKQKQLNYTRSLQALNQAKALFFPELGFSARFTVADGGRTIDFPVGDLMNPVYATLNELTHSQKFPMIENEQIYFIRPTEQETKLTLHQPLFNPNIFFHYKIRKDLSDAAFIDVEIYKRELVKEIKTAYFNYLKTVKALALFDQTMTVVKENVRVNESLYANDKVTLDVVYRSRAEFSKVERELAETQDLNQRAKGYFNFLMNRPLKSEIRILDEIHLTIKDTIPEQIALSTAMENREELALIREYQSISDNNLRLYKFNTAPTLGMAVDYGIQGENYSFGPEADFLFASVVMKWSIFKGFENRSKIREATINQDILDEQYQEVQKQINLQVTDAWYGVNTAVKTVNSSLVQSESAAKAFELISKRYYQGKSSLLEFIDARSSMTNAELNLIIARYDYEISLAELERTLALYPID